MPYFCNLFHVAIIEYLRLGNLFFLKKIKRFILDHSSGGPRSDSGIWWASGEGPLAEQAAEEAGTRGPGL